MLLLKYLCSRTICRDLRFVEHRFDLVMQTVVSIDYSELIREGHVELPTKLQSFLGSEVDSWKASVVSHLSCDHSFRLLKRHFSLQFLLEVENEEPVWIPMPYDALVKECLNQAQAGLKQKEYKLRVRLNPDRTVSNCGVP